LLPIGLELFNKYSLE